MIQKNRLRGKQFGKRNKVLFEAQEFQEMSEENITNITVQ